MKRKFLHCIIVTITENCNPIDIYSTRASNVITNPYIKFKIKLYDFNSESPRGGPVKGLTKSKKKMIQFHFHHGCLVPLPVSWVSKRIKTNKNIKVERNASYNYRM